MFECVMYGVIWCSGPFFSLLTLFFWKLQSEYHSLIFFFFNEWDKSAFLGMMTKIQDGICFRCNSEKVLCSTLDPGPTVQCLTLGITAFPSQVLGVYIRNQMRNEFFVVILYTTQLVLEN